MEIKKDDEIVEFFDRIDFLDSLMIVKKNKIEVLITERRPIA